MNGEDILIRPLTVLLEIAAVVSGILMLRQFRKNKQLIKARLFLLYDKLNRMTIAVVILIVIGIIFHMVYMVILGNDPNFQTSERYLSLGYVSTATVSVMIFIFLTVYFMLRPVGK